jgi:hypothetical protein
MNLGKCWIYKQQRPNEFRKMLDIQTNNNVLMNFVFRLSLLLPKGIKRKKLDNQLILLKVMLPATRI